MRGAGAPVFALALACAPADRASPPPDVVRAVAGHVAEGTGRERLVIVDALGAEPFAFAVRQALVTAGFRVAPPDGAFPTGAPSEESVTLHFERAAREGDGWRVWTRRTVRAPSTGSASVSSDVWLVGCAPSGCAVRDSVGA